MPGLFDDIIDEEVQQGDIFSEEGVGLEGEGLIDTSGTGLFEERASEAEQMILDQVMTTVEGFIHGDGRSNIVQMLETDAELHQKVATAAVGLISQAHDQAAASGTPIPPDVLFGQNGVIQNTTELVFEVAEAIGVPGSQNDENLNMAFVSVMMMIGEHEFQKGGQSTEEAAEFLIDLETRGLTEEGGLI